ncbi:MULTISPECIES: TraY domain-containing protein [Vibrio harveyi group]|uniref:Relaxosome protein TraY n=1 Tax=Vibrio parahaemolyticus TaxID=670 RepID=A0AA47JN47_VIBPH|nr:MULTISPECIES: TraY domain-containing protein [Vibrio harveyi group]KIP66053.1 conjugal transfer protein TraY [Vibrio harveyi]APX09996.1 conjugal transfer protein TraY [Vibrio campbellii]ARR10445.1 conjugal transfer protein TraY [Vibrio campbellii]EHR5465996.1 TraY domain-containing protein [Vibrio parahaemolyticus]MCR9907738.1 TraY domain-containing protein [Vibrio campbellii]
MPQNAEKETIGIWFELDEDTNRLLEESAEANDRSKRKEARFRLKDHLSKFNQHMKPRAKP